MEYRREIDGLRAVAVLIVILFHAGFAAFSGGFIGVDVFFVISGYLITSIIVGEVDAGKFSLGRFYERRARRIWPALVAILMVVQIAGAFVLMPFEFEGLSESLIAVVLFASNFYYWQLSGYFAPASELEPLLHTWSLAVEEQFYLLFPPVVWLISRWGRVRRLQVLLVGMAVSGVLSHWLVLNAPGSAFYLLPSRAWELLAGAVLAVLHVDYPSAMWRRHRVAGEVGGLLAVPLIVVPTLTFSETTPFPGLAAVAPVVGSVLVIHFASPLTVVGRLLGHALFVGIGLISYSAYLWHQPLLALGRRYVQDPGFLEKAGAVVASLVLAYCSWRLVESPFRRSGFLTRAQVFRWVAATSVVLLAVGAAGMQPAVSERLADVVSSDDDRALLQAIRVATKSGGPTSRYDDGACRFSDSRVTTVWIERATRCAASHGPALLVVGDSHGMDLFNATALTSGEAYVLGFVAPGCRPGDGGSNCYYDELVDALRGRPGLVRTVLYTQSGEYFYERRNPEFVLRQKNIDNTLAYLRRLGEVHPVIWLGPQAEVVGEFRALRLSQIRGGVRFATQIPRVDAYLQTFVPAQRVPGVTYLSKLDLIRFSPSDFMIDGQITFSDGDHWSRLGEHVFGGRLFADASFTARLR